MRRLEEKSAFISGGRQGIGRAIVDLFVSEGARVMTCGRGPRPADLPDTVIWKTANVSNTGEVSDLAKEIAAELGPLSILVNNAGVQIEKTLLDTTNDDWDQLMGVNAKGVFLMCRALIPQMQTGASIVNIGSISGNVADPGMALYNASKAFVHGLTRSVAVDHGPAVRCNAICPGWIMTDMADAAFATASDPAQAKVSALSKHPTGRFGAPEDIANMALWLASDDSTFANGQCFTVDGGLTAGSAIDPNLF